jgi:hypothetical protein
LSLMTKVMKARHRRCSRFMHSRITSARWIFSTPLFPSLDLFVSQCPSKKTQAPNPVFSLSLSLSLSQQGDKSFSQSVNRSNSPNSTPFENLANLTYGWIGNLEDWNQIRKLSLSD